jgi:hypothetical protein
MTDFNDIEKEYLRIEPLDNIRLEKFYLKYIDYFNGLEKVNADYFQKSIKMYIDVACSYSFADRHSDALRIISRIKPHLSIDLTSDHNEDVNTLFFCAAQSNLALKNYRQALNNFNKYRPGNKDLESTEQLKQLCKDILLNKSLRIIAIMGLTILVVKYSTKYLFTDFHSTAIDNFGWIGALSILAYSLFTRSTGKKNTA